MKIIIIGGGWYGCHIATILKSAHDITIIEQHNDIFINSSYYNQNRLHLGFHYCRDYNTRKLCQNNYNRFLKTYADCVDNIDDNYYAIADNSTIDFQTFSHIYEFEKHEFEIHNNINFANVHNKLILTKEKVINSDKIVAHFKTQLSDINLILNTKVSKYIKQNDEIIVYGNNAQYACDLLIDCTYNQLELSKKSYTYELTLSLIYQKFLNVNFGALTIVDGKFNSLYPRDIGAGIYTLTDVEFTPIMVSNNYADVNSYIPDIEEIAEIRGKMVAKMNHYYPLFEENFEYKSYFLSKKTKMLSKTDSRDITIEEIEPNVISVNCGKIYGIFEFEDYMLKYLELNQNQISSNF
jgi:hypothetical protein